MIGEIAFLRCLIRRDPINTVKLSELPLPYPLNFLSSPYNIPNILDKPTLPMVKDTSEAYNSSYKNSTIEIF